MKDMERDKDQDDFDVEDESPAEVRAAWKRGEAGVTNGPRDLNQRAKGIVDRAVEQLDTVTIELPWITRPPSSAAAEATSGSSNITETDESLAHA